MGAREGADMSGLVAEKIVVSGFTEQMILEGGIGEKFLCIAFTDDEPEANRPRPLVAEFGIANKTPALPSRGVVYEFEFILVVHQPNHLPGVKSEVVEKTMVMIDAVVGRGAFNKNLCQRFCTRFLDVRRRDGEYT